MAELSNYAPGSDTPNAPWNQDDINPRKCGFCCRWEDENHAFSHWDPDVKKWFCSADCMISAYLDRFPQEREPLMRTYNKISEALKVLDDDQEADAVLKALGINTPYHTKERLVELLEAMGSKEGTPPLWTIQT